MEKVYVQQACIPQDMLRENFYGNVEKLAAAGYDGIELFGGFYGGKETGRELNEYLNSLGLELLAAHVGIEETEQNIEFFKNTECKYIVCPGLHLNSAEEAYAAADSLNRMGALCNAAGLRYGYHNHNNDFKWFGDLMALDILIQNTDPAQVTFELDVGWAWRGGVNAADFIRKYAGRFELIHVKETTRVFGEDDGFEHLFKKYNVQFKRGERPNFPPEMQAEMQERMKTNCKLGDGIIDMPAVKLAADAQGTKAYIVEREFAYTGDIVSSLVEDCEYLKKL